MGHFHFQALYCPIVYQNNSIPTIDENTIAWKVCGFFYGCE